MFAVVLGGYDFENQILALSEDFIKAQELADKENKKITQLPWNGVFVIEVPMNEVIEFEGAKILYAAGSGCAQPDKGQ